MKVRVGVPVALFLALFFDPSGMLAQSRYPAPRSPEILNPTTVEELLPGIRRVLDEFHIRFGTRVLLVTDTTVEPLVNQALLAGLREARAEFEGVILSGKEDVTSPLEQIKLWGLNWWPEWVWDRAAQDYQVVLSPSYLVHIHTSKGKLRMMPWLAQNNLRYGRMHEPAAKLAYKPWMEFPKELETAIIEKVLENLPRQRTRVRVTDPEGTDFTYDDNWDWFLKGWEQDVRPINAGSLHTTGSPIQYLNANGVVVSRDLHLGPLSEPVKLHFENSRITKIEGGGDVGDYARRQIERYKDRTFMTTRGYGVTRPGPLKGLGWLEEAAFMTHPKWIRVPDYGKNGNTFTTAFNNWLGMGRSGVFHVAIGLSESTAWGPALMPEDDHDFHIDFLNYFVTLTIGQWVAIRDGRLTVLDDPEVRRVAAKYGNPDELLKEDWIPAIPGVNVK